MKSLEALIQTIEDIPTDDKLNNLLKALPLEHGYHWCGILLFRPLSAMNQEVVSFGEIPHKIKSKMTSSSKLYRYCTNHCRAIAASDVLDISDSEHQEYKQILLLPLKGCASNSGCLMIQVNAETQTYLKQIGWYWSILGPYLYDAAQRVSDLKSAVISKRELECIRWASEGKTLYHWKGLETLFSNMFSNNFLVN